MWYFDNEEFQDIGEYIGFVYLITNLTNGRKYIGKKNLYFSKSRQVKGKRKRFKVESDWRDYYGSNKELQEEVEKLGKEVFRREILRLCISKGEASYFEAKEQFTRNVLETDEYYNVWISCKIRKSHLTFLNK
jgi:hypothetical protein